MTPLRQRMLEDMQLRNLSPRTQESYVYQVSLFARYFHKSPELLKPNEIRAYLLYLTNEKKLAPASIAVAIWALRFLYQVTLKKNWCFQDILPTPKQPRKLPVILSPEEVVRFLGCITHHMYRVILTVCYAAGLRISEAVGLTVSAIDSQRMVLRVVQGKGRKDRYVMLSPKLLQILREWWRIEKPKHWLFPCDRPDQHVHKNVVETACREFRRSYHFAKAITPHSLRHAFAVHLLEQGVDIRTIQLLLGHRSIATTARYLQVATTKVCSATSPLDLLPQPAKSQAL
jgi:integrase/recombinase XerD